MTTALLWLFAGAMLGGAGVATWSRRRPDKASEPISIEVGEESLLNASIQRAEYLQTALDALPMGVVIADSNGDVLMRNRVSQSIGDAAHVLVHASVEHHLRSALRGTQRSQTLELHGPPRRVVVVTAQSLSSGGAVATVEDVTERARLDATRTDFVANISHELKTPIGALAVLAETLIDESDPATLRRLASKTVDEAHRVGRTIDDLLELSRIELSGEIMFQAVDVGQLIGAAIARSHYLAESRQVQVKVGDVPQACRVYGDQLQLESALGNLVDNAVKYSEAGDVVSISVECDLAEVVFEVTDEGIGIPPSELDRIFERFYRVDRARSRATGGTGLGLSIVRHVAQNHGGTVTVTSRVGEGSAFRIAVPIERRTDDRLLEEVLNE
jgi:two-component system, OmpR family, sensor histidine kinase SenX3